MAGNAANYVGMGNYYPQFIPFPGTMATNAYRSQDIARGQTLNNPYTNYLVNGVVPGMQNDIFTNWQVINGAPPLFAGDPTQMSSWFQNPTFGPVLTGPFNSVVGMPNPMGGVGSYNFAGAGGGPAGGAPNGGLPGAPTGQQAAPPAGVQVNQLG